MHAFRFLKRTTPNEGIHSFTSWRLRIRTNIPLTLVTTFLKRIYTSFISICSIMRSKLHSVHRREWRIKGTIYVIVTVLLNDERKLSQEMNCASILTIDLDIVDKLKVWQIDRNCTQNLPDFTYIYPLKHLPEFTFESSLNHTVVPQLWRPCLGNTLPNITQHCWLAIK